MLQHIKNIYFLGVKELIGLCRDGMMMFLIVYVFTVNSYMTATGTLDTVNNARIAIVDEDHSQLSERISQSFLPPLFLPPVEIARNEMDLMLDRGEFTFVLDIPSEFEKDVKAGRSPKIQLNVDATRMSEAFAGGGYIQQIIDQEVAQFCSDDGTTVQSATLVLRDRYNANLTESWFEVVMDIVNNITMLAIILTGAALIRERENGTLEHLLVMPVNAFEIMVSKVWSMMLVVLIASGIGLFGVAHWWLKVPMQGSYTLYMVGVALHLFAVTSMGIFLACIADNMPQMGLLMILILMPMSMLSGGSTPMESMPEFVQYLMQLAPTTHFVTFSKAILFRGAGITVVWKPFLAIFAIGAALFAYSLKCFKQSLASS